MFHFVTFSFHSACVTWIITFVMIGECFFGVEDGLHLLQIVEDGSRYKVPTFVKLYIIYTSLLIHCAAWVWWTRFLNSTVNCFFPFIPLLVSFHSNSILHCAVWNKMLTLSNDCSTFVIIM